MGKVFERIDAPLEEFIRAQQMFFVATAPSGDNGHVNLSPKGLDTLRVLDAHTLAYLDYVGSGAETIAHLRENGRIVIMLCAFDGPPRIVRLHGEGEIVLPEAPEFEPLLAVGFDEPAAPQDRRAIIRVRLTRVSDSCGYGVPLMAYEGERPHADLSTAKRLRVHGPDAMIRYQQKYNRVSIDGLPAVQ